MDYIILALITLLAIQSTHFIGSSYDCTLISVDLSLFYSCLLFSLFGRKVTLSTSLLTVATLKLPAVKLYEVKNSLDVSLSFHFVIFRIYVSLVGHFDFSLTVTFQS